MQAVHESGATRSHFVRDVLVCKLKHLATPRNGLLVGRNVHWDGVPNGADASCDQLLLVGASVVNAQYGMKPGIRELTRDPRLALRTGAAGKETLDDPEDVVQMKPPNGLGAQLRGTGRQRWLKHPSSTPDGTMDRSERACHVICSASYDTSMVLVR